MSSYSSLRTFKCPSCSATLAANDDDRTLTCQYCGTLVEVPGSRPAAEAPRPPLPSAPVVMTSTTTARQSVRGGCWVWAIVGVLLFIAVVPILGVVVPVLIGALGAGAWLGLSTGIAPILPPRVRVQDLLVLPAANDGPPEVLASTYDYDAQADTLTYLDMDPPTVRWNSPVFSSTTFYGMNYTMNTETLYLADETRLLALQRLDGALAWQATLSDKFYSACIDCLQLVAGQVVALTDDGQLQAFDARTGSPAWSVRLEETPRRLFGVGPQVAVVDAEGDATVLKVFDAASGELARQIEPLGKNDPFPDDPQALELYTPVLADPDGASLYFFMGFFPPLTVQRWNVLEDRMLWEATLNDDQVSLTAHSAEPVLAGGTLYFSNGAYEEKAAVIAVAVEQGSARSLPAPDPDYQLAPLAAQDGTLVVSATRTRGTRRIEVWALDDQTGAVLWKHLPQAGDLADDTFFDLSGYIYQSDGATATATASTAGVWTWRLASGRLLLLEVLSNQVVVNEITLKDGASRGPVTLQLRLSDSSANRVEVKHWNNRQAWLNVDGSLQVFDLETGALASSWPN
jgi:outer membrane protein assembly factor BamB